MFLCVDVHYEDHAAVTACVGFNDWSDPNASLEFVERSESAPEPYEPGQFYKRELPHLLSAVEQVRCSVLVEVVIIDGHVWLSENRPGLGVHLHHALGGGVAIIGVAKTAFREGVAVPVLRGQSRQSLFVTAMGMDAAQAEKLVRSMHGPHRLPTLLKRADQLARGNERSDPSKRIMISTSPE